MKYAATRVGAGLITAWGVVTAVFLALHIVPGSPAELILSGGGGGGGNVSPAAVAKLNAELGLNRPLLAQYGSYMGHLLHGNLGTSIQYSAPVTSVIGQELVNTAVLVLIATLIGGVIGISCGAVAGNWSGSAGDRLLSGVMAIAVATPGFVAAVFLSNVVGLKLGWLPALGFSPLSAGLGPYLSHALLPSVALSLAYMAIICRVTRTSVIAARREDWVRTANGLGLKPSAVFRRHIFRNAINPVVTVSGLQIGALLGATVLVEQVFNWPGVGNALLNAINNRDYPMVQGIVLVLAIAFIALNIVVDLLYRVLDPRVAA